MCLLTRILKIIDNEQLTQEENKVNQAQQAAACPPTTLIHQAIMKAVCYSQSWIKQINNSAPAKDLAFDMNSTDLSPSLSYDCRILVIQTGQDNPQHFNALTNAVFACQKLRICLDCLVMDKVKSPVINVDVASAANGE